MLLAFSCRMCFKNCQREILVIGVETKNTKALLYRLYRTFCGEFVVFKFHLIPNPVKLIGYSIIFVG